MKKEMSEMMPETKQAPPSTCDKIISMLDSLSPEELTRVAEAVQEKLSEESEEEAPSNTVGPLGLQKDEDDDY